MFRPKNAVSTGRSLRDAGMARMRDLLPFVAFARMAGFGDLGDPGLHQLRDSLGEIRAGAVRKAYHRVCLEKRFAVAAANVDEAVAVYQIE